MTPPKNSIKKGGCITAPSHMSLFHRCESILGETAYRADPILRQVLKRGTRGDPVIRIADFRVIHISAGALILLHS